MRLLLLILTKIFELSRISSVFAEHASKVNKIGIESWKFLKVSGGFARI